MSDNALLSKMCYQLVTEIKKKTFKSLKSSPPAEANECDMHRQVYMNFQIARIKSSVHEWTC